MGYNPDNSMKITSGRDSNYRSNEVGGTRPKGDPKAGRDFKKVLAKADDEDEENPATKEIIEETDGILVPVVDEKKKKPAMSLFDLTSSKGTAKPSHLNSEAKVESPASLYAKMTSPVEAKKNVKEVFVDTENLEPDPEIAVSKDKFTTRFSTEQTDLSYINPIAGANQQPSVNLNISTDKLVVPVTNIQSIIDQMVEKVTEMKNAGTTETVVTLKHPPLFAGATIVVTGFDSANNEFNISIENLSQAAKNLMDQQGNKDSLLLALEQKGYAVHILTTTTLAENRPVDSLPQEGQTGRQRDDEKEGKQQQQQQREREDTA